MNENIKSEVADRLKKYLLKTFGSIAEAARQLEVPENTLRYSYLNAKSLPGFETLYQLQSKGCDIKWLITGKKATLDIDINSLKGRIDYHINLLIKKFDIHPIELDDEKIVEIIKHGTFDDRIEARTIISKWKQKESLLPTEFVNLARLTEASLSKLLCGVSGPELEYVEGFLLSFPEIELIYKLKNNPELFKKIQNYVKSKLSENEIDSLNS